jgi:fatty-acyl-CoA synthase
MTPTSHWPRDLPRRLTVPDVTLSTNLDQAVARWARQRAIHFLGYELSYAEFGREVDRMAGWLQRVAGVARGDRVLLYLQNSPQWLIAYYGALRADAVVVPVNPMNRESELAHCLIDSGAKVVVCAQDLLPTLRAASSGQVLAAVVQVCYADYLSESAPAGLPDWLTQPPSPPGEAVPWHTVMEADLRPSPCMANAEDSCGIFYTSGSTGAPKGCVLTHKAFQHNIMGQALWHWTAPGTAVLASAPMFHVSGLNHGVHLPVLVGGVSVILPRWDRRQVLETIERQGIGHATIAPTALLDLLSAPDIASRDLSSLRRLTAGGAPMPKPLAERVREVFGLSFVEAYGLTETAATTHLNPIHRVKANSVGIPFFGTSALVVEPESDRPVPPGTPGEVLVHGPQLFSGYWNNPAETAKAFCTIGGVRYFRTGDIGQLDEEGYLFLTDRAKRMINASGYKVWPAEVERLLLEHPGVHEVCVIATADPYRGETVKAVVVRRTGESFGEEDLIAWARERMSAYKYPRIVQFVDALPKSNVGKVLWRELQAREPQPPQKDTACH